MPSMPYAPYPLPAGPTLMADRTLSASPAHAADDQDLIRRVAARDRHAFEQLYHRYAPPLRRYLRRWLPPHVLPEDVLQEVMLLVWHQAGRWDPSKPLGAWLFGIAHHKASEARRAARPRSAPPPAAAAERVMEALEVGVARHELSCIMMQALGDLPPAERQVVELTYYHGLSYPEIAALVACPVNTVKARMAQARHRLAPQLRALGLAPAPDPAALPPYQTQGAPVRARPPQCPDL